MRRIFKILNTPVARSSAVFYFGSFALGVGRYTFHLVLLRLLLPAEYGEFLAYLSLLYLLGIPNSTVNTVVVKFVAEFRGAGDARSINRLFYFLLRKLLPVTLVICALLIIFSTPLSVLFKAHPVAFIILGISVVLTSVGSIIKSYLTAFHRFVAAIVIGTVEIILTIVLAVILIKLHLAATGAVSAQLLAGLVGLVICFFVIKKSIYPPNKEKQNFNLKSFTGFSLINAVGALSLISTDVLLVRTLMTEHLSGIYSSLAIISRTVYFILGPLIALALPIAAHRHTLTKSARSVFFKLGGALVAFGSVLTAGFILLPNFIIRFVSGANYLEAVPYLPMAAIAMFLFSLNLFVVNFFMAIGQPKINLYLLMATVLQPVLMLFFHSSLQQIVINNLIVESILFVFLARELSLRRTII